ncbi:NAD(P)/FAD-dependent oxidoreductase, partial [Streptomyces lunaelactis]
VTLASGRAVRARRLVVTTGLVDEIPGIRGVAERWGQDVLHCPYCHGWEVRDRAFGVIASPVKGAYQALLVSQWSDDVTLFLHTVDTLTDEDWRLLAAAGVSVVTGEVASLVVEEDSLTGVRMASGRVFPCEALFVGPRFRPNDGLLGALGAEMSDTPFGPFVTVDETGRTTVPGVWAAGNAVGPGEQVVNAASAGYRAGVTINNEMVFSDLEEKAAVRAAGVFSAVQERAVAERVLGDRAHGLPI